MTGPAVRQMKWEELQKAMVHSLGLLMDYCNRSIYILYGLYGIIMDYGIIMGLVYGLYGIIIYIYIAMDSMGFFHGLLQLWVEMGPRDYNIMDDAPKKTRVYNLL